MASIELKGSFKPMIDVLDKIAGIGQQPANVLNAVGEQMIKATQERFHKQAGPDGSPWAPLKPAYAAKKTDPRILFRTGELFGSIEKFVDGNRLVWGSHLIYAGTHQFGIFKKVFVRSSKRGPQKISSSRRVVIPARPYLGFTADDRQTVLEELEEFFGRAVASR